MQFLVYGIIVSSLSFGYLGDMGYVPPALDYAQELFAIATAAVVVALGVQQKFRYVAPIYWLVFGGIALTMVCGIVVNHVGAGPVFAGTRTYLRAFPYFFLPAVVDFSDKQIRRHLTLILVLALIQLPIALEQRLESFGHGYLSGDRTIGTLGSSAYLSIFLICVALVLFAFYLRKRLSLTWMLILMALVLVPTMINETKATILLFPLGMFVVAVIGANRNRLRNTLRVVVIGSLFLGAFVPIYDHFMEPKWGYGIIEFLTMQGRVEGYLDKGSTVGSYEEAGRWDGIVAPLQTLSRDPAQLGFGLGIGNVSPSSLGDSFTGANYLRYGYLVTSLLSLLLWETGVIGTTLVFILLSIVFLDAFKVSRGTGFRADLALGAMGVIAIIFIGTGYKLMVASGALSFLFWYLAGVVTAERVRRGVYAAEGERSRDLAPTPSAGSFWSHGISRV
jgi:hypothetical protein